MTRLNTTARAGNVIYGTNLREAVSTASVNLTILGHLPSMKNGRAIFRNRMTGKPFSAKSNEARAYAGSFVLQVPAECKRLALGSEKTPLRAIVSVWYRSNRSDLDTALVYDCLQAAGVISNDRYVLEHHEFKHIDRRNPRVEITLEEL